MQIVHQKSAIREGSDMMFLLTDHSGLNKFWGHDDPNFKNVRDVIIDMVRIAPRNVENYCNSKRKLEWESFLLYMLNTWPRTRPDESKNAT